MDSIFLYLSLGTIDTWDWIILCCGGCPVHCRMLRMRPQLLLTAPHVTPNMSLPVPQCPLDVLVFGGTILSLVEK